MKAVICNYKRSPFTPAKRGELARVNPVDILAQTIKATVPPHIADKVDDVIIGCAFPEGEQGFNVGKLAATLAGLPKSVGGMTINRFCGSSMEAVHIAAGKVLLNPGTAYVAGGVESMSRIPMGGFNPLPSPSIMESHPEMYVNMGITAENVAREFNISREEQDAFAINSHQKAEGVPPSSKGITPIRIADTEITDDGFRSIASSSITDLSGKRSAFLKGGSVTSANSSPLTDGASAVIVCSEWFASKNELDVLAVIESTAVVGNEPELMGIAPVAATLKALERAQLTVQDIDNVELNEAFASQALACMKELSLDPTKVNVLGGALATGHPLGATGCRLVGQVAMNLRELDGRYGLAAQCIGGGQGIATVLRNPNWS